MNEYFCTDCGEVIPPRRSAILEKDYEEKRSWSTPPDQWLCIKCQERLERSQDKIERRGSIAVPAGVMAVSSEPEESTSFRERGIVAMPDKAVLAARKVDGKARLIA